MNDLLQKISKNSYGLLPTNKSVIQAIVSLLIIIGSAYLFWYSKQASKPSKPDTSQFKTMKTIYEKEYLLNKAKKQTQ